MALIYNKTILLLYLDKISNEFKIGSCGVKNQVTRSPRRKPCVCSVGMFVLIHIHVNVSENTLEMGCACSKGSGERLQDHHCPLFFDAGYEF